MLTKFIDKPFFQYSLIIYLVAEFLSLWAYTYSSFNWLLLAVMTIGAIILIWRDFRWAIFLPMAEIFWGSLGRTFYWPIGGFSLSVRMLLFALVILIWLIKYLPDVTKVKWRSGLNLSLLGFFIVIAWGVFRGFIGHNSLLNIFDDSNGFYFIVYILMWQRHWRPEYLSKIFALLISATIIISLKTLFIFHIFSHAYEIANIQFLYLWIRDTKVGELTLVVGNFWRIFFQSHIQLVIAWLGTIIALLISQSQKINIQTISYLALLLAAILVSFSRSFWLAAIVTLLFFIIIGATILFRKKSVWPWRKIFQLKASFLLGVVFLAVVLFIPYVDANLSSALASRLGAGEAAASSRLNQLPVLLDGIKQHPLLGSGFGSTLTYQNNDPRIRNFLNPDGTYSTYAFEIGWLDIVFKVGALGLLIILTFIIKILWDLWKLIKSDQQPEILIPLGFSIIFLMIVHLFTPFINHPLGLVWLILTFLIVQSYGDKTQGNN